MPAKSRHHPLPAVQAAAAPLDVNQLLIDAYASAPAPQKNHIIALLIGKLYKDAPLLARGHLLQHLTRPLSLLSLAAIAGGIFARLHFRSGWPDLRAQLEEAAKVQVGDVVALADYVQQVSTQAVDSLAQLIAAEPMMAGSAAAAVLVSVLMLRAKARRSDAAPALLAH